MSKVRDELKNLSFDWKGFRCWMASDLLEYLGYDVTKENLDLFFERMVPAFTSEDREKPSIGDVWKHCIGIGMVDADEVESKYPYNYFVDKFGAISFMLNAPYPLTKKTEEVKCYLTGCIGDEDLPDF